MDSNNFRAQYDRLLLKYQIQIQAVYNFLATTAVHLTLWEI